MATSDARSDSRKQSRSHSGLSPIDTLPAELVREIVLLVTEPDTQPRTMSLSHVSLVWWDVCLSCTSLFVKGNWGEWPVWLLELWCARANGRRLRVKLDQKGMHRLSDALHAEQGGRELYEKQTLLTLVDETRRSWSTLSAYCNPLHCLMAPHEHQQCGAFLLSNAPQLLTLIYCLLLG